MHARIGMLVVMGILAMVLHAFAGAPTNYAINIGCGGSGGAYYQQICPALKQRLEALGFTNINIHESSGSGQNITDVVAGTRTAALVQMDVLAEKIQENSEYAFLLPMGQITPEALFIVVSKNGRVGTWETLAQDYPDGMAPSKKFMVAVAGSQTSGSYLTVQTLMRNLPAMQQYVELKPLAMSPQVVYNYLNNRAADAVSFVMMPDITNERISMVLNSQSWKFLEINDPRIESIQVQENAIYTLMDIPLEGDLSSAWGRLTGAISGRTSPAKVLRTPVTYSTLLVDPAKTPDAVVRALSEIANDPDLLAPNAPTGIASRWYKAAKAAVGK